MEIQTENKTFYNEDMKQKFEELIKNDDDFVFHIDNFWKIRDGLFRIMQDDKKKYFNILPMCQSLDGIISIMVETGKGRYYPPKNNLY